MKAAPSASEERLYDSDYFTWTRRQAEHIRLDHQPGAAADLSVASLRSR